MGTLGGTSSAASGINNSGEVVGYSETAAGKTHAFLHIGGSLLDLGTFGDSETYADRITDSGIVLGHLRNASGRYRPFITSVGSPLFDLSSLDHSLEGPVSAASGVNNSGQVVSYRHIPRDEHSGLQKRAFLYSDHKIIDLGTFGGTDSFATAINDSGQVVGYFSPTTDVVYTPYRAFLLSGGAVIHLGNLGGRITVPVAINNVGQVVGHAQVPGGETHAFLYSSGRMRDLGTLPGGIQSFAYGINSCGRVVGASNSAAARLRAFLYSDGKMQDLNRLIPAHSGWVLYEAREINDAGQIVGNGMVNGQQRAFLLTPLLTPSKMISNLVNTVEGLNLPRRTANRLNARLRNASDALDPTNKSGNALALNMLDAFLNLVKAQWGKSLTDVQAKPLIAAANRIKTTLSSRGR
ncbi:MAG: HAF repeat-containing protein [Acidobacteriota bacterium]|nr:HAF repeat-containing protein [Acidobacteriota bacterium]